MSSPAAVPVLMYHHVSPTPGLVTVSPGHFRQHMAGLAEAGYRSIGCDDLEAYLAGRPLPEKSVLITFDDGYLDNYIHAWPVLREFGLKAVIFLVTGWAADGPPRPLATAAAHSHSECKARIAAGRADDVILRWSEARAMVESGAAEFHSHTHTHQRWDRLGLAAEARDARLAADLRASRQALAAELGAASEHLCWPQGFFDAGYCRVAKECGFSHLYTTLPGTNTGATPRDAIRRIVVKDRPGAWLASRLRIYRRPWLAAAYHLLK